MNVHCVVVVVKQFCLWCLAFLSCLSLYTDYILQACYSQKTTDGQINAAWLVLKTVYQKEKGSMKKQVGRQVRVRKRPKDAVVVVVVVVQHRHARQAWDERRAQGRIACQVADSPVASCQQSVLYQSMPEMYSSKKRKTPKSLYIHHHHRLAPISLPQSPPLQKTQHACIIAVSLRQKSTRPLSLFLQAARHWCATCQPPTTSPPPPFSPPLTLGDAR